MRDEDSASGELSCEGARGFRTNHGAKLCAWESGGSVLVVRDDEVYPRDSLADSLISGVCGCYFSDLRKWVERRVRQGVPSGVSVPREGAGLEMPDQRPRRVAVWRGMLRPASLWAQR